MDKRQDLLELARFLNGRGVLHLFDYGDVAIRVRDRLATEGLKNVAVHGCSRCSHDSYNWNLMRLLRDAPELRFDYVYLDGAHTWETDGLAFFLCDMLLKQKRFYRLRRLRLVLCRITHMQPGKLSRYFQDVHCRTGATPHVALVVNLLVRRSGVISRGTA